MDAAATLELDSIDRDALVDGEGRKFKDFRRSLRARYRVIWGEIAAGYVALGATAAGIIFVDTSYPRLLPVAVLLGALVIGYFIAYIQLFFHEAAHFNVAPERKLNDWLANVFIGSFVGQDIKAYRVVHFDHHRFLGTPQDTERSYFNPLTVRFVIEGLTGLHVLRVLMQREKTVKAVGSDGVAGRKFLNRHLLAGLAFHAVIIGAMLLAGQWALALAWVLGVGAVHPFVNAVRQLIEHRDFDARSSIDYAQQAHGPVNRTFGDGPLATTLGGAGFNRHLLHHWEPQISYTRFRELERYLLATSAAETFKKRQTTYIAAAVRLMRAP